MKGAEGFVQAYNTQVAVEPVFQLIVGQAVTPAENDKQQLVPSHLAEPGSIHFEIGIIGRKLG
jgi:hypothetical protein